MKQHDDVTRLSQLLREQHQLVQQLGATRDAVERAELERRVQSHREDCFLLVERYFRLALGPALVRRFPGKVSPPRGAESDDSVALLQYTELVNDFFVQVLGKFDDPFWRKETAIELRNHASTVISNDIRDAFRKRRKQQPTSDDQVRESFEQQLASEVEARFHRHGLDLELRDVLDVLDQWQSGDNQRRRRMAAVIRLKYLVEMTMEQIAGDLKVPTSTAYGYHREALQALRQLLAPARN